MSNVTVEKNTGIGLAGWLGLLFIGLKLTGNIHWAWVWVVSPFWIPLAIVLSILLLAGILAVIAVVLDGASSSSSSVARKERARNRQLRR